MSNGGNKMFIYKRADQVGKEQVFEAFQKGFADYLIKFEMTQEVFFHRFFGIDGNDLSLSYVAFDEDRPMGLILGGIKEFDGVRTMRCGTLCIIPEYRGKGVSSGLLDLHIGSARENHCAQLFLEVINGNDRAVSFYEKNGYERVYDLKYYTLDRQAFLREELETDASYPVREMELKEALALRSRFTDLHLNWQADFDVLEKSSDVILLGAYHGEDLAGFMAFKENGRIVLLWVDAPYRNRGLGRRLLSHAAQKVNVEKLHISFSNHGPLSGFVKKTGFTEDQLSQYEMYRFL